MNIFDEFRRASAPAGAPTSAAPASAAVNPNLPTGATPVNQPGGPAAFPAAPAVADADKSPLAGYEKLWENDPNVKAPNMNPVPTFTMDPKALSEAVSKMDFAGSVPAELMDKAMKGDQASFAEAMNLVARNSFAQSAQATGKIVERAVQQTADKMLKEVLPTMLSQHANNAHLRQEVPLLDNPAVKPIADFLSTQVQAKNPNASPAEITNQVRGYLAGFAKFVSEAKIGASAAATQMQTDVVSTKTGGKSDNWEDFFGVGGQ